tara:strand:+ start:157 stop:318 length:162 start_codon:yes stop_codon:yes gene_type:complete
VNTKYRVKWYAVHNKKPAKYRKLFHKYFGSLLKIVIFVLRYAMKQTTLKTKTK